MGCCLSDCFGKRGDGYEPLVGDTPFTSDTPSLAETLPDHHSQGSAVAQGKSRDYGAVSQSAAVSQDQAARDGLQDTSPRSSASDTLPAAPSSQNEDRDGNAPSADSEALGWRGEETLVKKRLASDADSDTRGERVDTGYPGEPSHVDLKSYPNDVTSLRDPRQVAQSPVIRELDRSHVTLQSGSSDDLGSNKVLPQQLAEAAEGREGQGQTDVENSPGNGEARSDVKESRQSADDSTQPEVSMTRGDETASERDDGDEESMVVASKTITQSGGPAPQTHTETARSQIPDSQTADRQPDVEATQAESISFVVLPDNPPDHSDSVVAVEGTTELEQASTALATDRQERFQAEHGPGSLSSFVVLTGREAASQINVKNPTSVGDATPSVQSPGDAEPNQESWSDVTPSQTPLGDNVPDQESLGDAEPNQESLSDVFPSHTPSGDDIPSQEASGDLTPSQEETLGDVTEGQQPIDDDPQGRDPGHDNSSDVTRDVRPA